MPGDPSDAELPSPPLGSTLAALAARGDVRRYRKGVILIEEGDRGDTLFIILSGRLRVYSAGENGREVTYGEYGPGEYLGEMSLDGGLRSASVQTLETSVCAVVSRDSLRNFLVGTPEFAFDLLAKVIRRARSATLSTKLLALNDVYGRLKFLLESLGTVQPDGSRVITQKITRQEMANRLGCTREMVSRVMKDLESGGYVFQDGGRLILRTSLPARW